MEFTYNAYRVLLDRLHNMGYQFRDFQNWNDSERVVILRHDVDYDMKKAVKMAEIENSGGVLSTYCVLLSSDFYNVFSRECSIGLKKIKDLGHKIGLHFDEKRYYDISDDLEILKSKIQYESSILSSVVEDKVKVVSMHRPSHRLLEADITVTDMINSYSRMYVKDFKYVSDSRRRWREPVKEYIENKTYNRLHILIHPFWYKETELGLADTIKEYVKRGSIDRYVLLNKNFTNLSEIVKREEIL